MYIFIAESWDVARQKAIAIGRSKEELYRNENGEQVRWAFERLVTLDLIDEIVDGSEVYSQPFEISESRVPFDRKFEPEASEPTQSV